jgi:hypothetical protein
VRSSHPAVGSGGTFWEIENAQVQFSLSARSPEKALGLRTIKISQQPGAPQ